MLLTKKQLAWSLSQLIETDYTLLSDIIVEYVELLGNTNRMHDMHEYTCKELESDLGIHS